MPDLCLDTNVLAELLRQYYTRPSPFRAEPKGAISPAVTKRINQIIQWHEGTGYEPSTPFGIVVASVIAFVEIGRQPEKIFQGDVDPWQIAAFVEQPPDWCSIEPFGFPVLEEFVGLKNGVWMSEQWFPIEGNDNYHVSTMKTRDTCLLATTDGRLRAAYPDLVL